MKEAVKDGKKIGVKSNGPFPAPQGPCTAHVEGPWSPKPHVWYAQVQVNADGWITKVV